MSDTEVPADTHFTPSPTGDGIPRGRLRRSGPFVKLTARTAGEAVVAGLRHKLTGADVADFHIRTAERYAELLGNSKGALMKAGQMLSLMPVAPTVPAEFRSTWQTALARLCSEAPPMAPELAQTVLERELGQPTESIFSRFDREPFAAASIGQVHAARLHDGRAVAVKIQYPGAAEAIAADLENTELLATLVSLIFGVLSPRRLSLDFRGAARELSERITDELDYRLEAANQTAFAEHYRDHPFIRVPEVVGELSTERVLTQELVLGLAWSDALAAKQDLRDQWAEAIWRFTYGTSRHIHLLYADPHPGNYVFHEDGGVSFLDFGCVKRVDREYLAMIDAIVGACRRHDVLGTWRACVEAGWWRSSDPVTPEEAFDFWWGDYAMLWARERFVVTPEYAAKRIARRISPDGPSANAIRYVTIPPEYTLMGRIEIGAASIVGELRAGVNWGAMSAEYFENAAPVTEMGKRERAFREGRGAPAQPRRS